MGCNKVENKRGGWVNKEKRKFYVGNEKVWQGADRERSDLKTAKGMKAKT